MTPAIRGTQAELRKERKNRHDWRVYFLYQDDRLVYVGKTCNWRERVSQHFADSRYAIVLSTDWNRYEISDSFTDEETAKAFESQAIANLSPLLNGTREQTPLAMGRRALYLSDRMYRTFTAAELQTQVQL